MKQELKAFFKKRPIANITRDEIFNRFDSFSHDEVSSAIKSLMSDGTIFCVKGGRYPIYADSTHDYYFKQNLKDQELGIRTRLMMMAVSSQFNYTSREEIVNIFSEIDEDGERFYNESVVSFVVDMMFEEGILRELKSGAIRYIVGSIPFKFSKVSNDNLYTLADGKMTFGVEHEFISRIPCHVIAHIFRDLGFKSISEDEIFEEKYKFWHVGSDGSIDTNMTFVHDVEIASRVLKGKKGLAELDRYFQVIGMFKQMNIIDTNTSAGIHVHHGSFKSDFQIKNLVKNFSSSQSIMNLLFEKHRYDHGSYNYAAEANNYFHKNGRVNFKHDRTMNLNLNPYKNIGTVEFRQCESTFNAKKILAWIVIGQKIIKESAKIDFSNEFNHLQDFFKTIKLNPRAQQIFKKKLNKAPIID